VGSDLGVARGLLRFSPSGWTEFAPKLAGADDACRIRIGDCRVADVIADKVLIVYIIRVGHRKEV